MRILLVALYFFTSSALCDVSHLDHVYFDQVSSLYQVPAFSVPSTTSLPILPEIIINRKTKEPGYNYYRPQDTYLPPQNNPSFPPEEHIPPNLFPQIPQTTPVPFPPIVVGDPLVPIDDRPPNPEYIPPLNGGKPDIVVSYPNDDQDNKHGYDYNQPTASSTTTQRPVIFPLGPEADVPNTPPSGYVYNTPNPPVVSYLPPATERAPKDLFGFQPKNSIRLQIAEMRCVLSQGGYFKSVLKVDSFLVAVPVVDNDLIDTRCDLRLYRSHLIINIGSEDFQRCGVVHCGHNHLCLRIRFPVIKGMKTASDSVLTLQCKTQDRIVSKTHALKLGITSKNIQGRNIGAYAQGGNQQPFRTHIELLRKTSNGFTRTLEPNGVVQLGEELQLKAHVQPGDGWNYTRLSDVQLQRLSPSGEILNSAVLVTTSGCVNPSMHAICPVPPIFEPPLGHRLSFKAVMFQGMRSGDEMLMTIKIAGCMEHTDCFNNADDCESTHSNNNRLKRSIGQNATTQISDVSTISFRVEVPKMIQPNVDTRANVAYSIVGGIIVFICLLCLLATFLYYKLRD